MKSRDHALEEIERSLLGLVLVDKKIINNVRGYLTPEDFFNANNALIFQSCLELLNEGFEIELSLVVARIKSKNRLEAIGGVPYLSQLMSEAGLASNVSKYVKTIVEQAQLRNVKRIILDLNEEVDKPRANPEAISELLESKITASTRGIEQKQFQSAKQVVNKTLDELKVKAGYKGISGIPSFFASLDHITSGFQKGDLIIFAARPSMGKTAFALNIAKRVSEKYNVALFSLEMPATQLFNRILSFSSLVSGEKLRQPSRMNSDDWSKLNTMSQSINKLNLYTDDSAGIKLAELVWKARRLHKNVGIDVIIIDYLQLLTISSKSLSENRQAEVSRISLTLKQLARELNIPVIALSQLSRRVEQRENKKPMMSDLRESGAIEQDADIVAFLYREAYYNKVEESPDSTTDITEIIISKHRNGATGSVFLSFNPEIGKFSDIKGTY